MEQFDPEFLLGTATAAHQVEGNNTNSDCWALEHIPHSSYAEPSGDAVDHYHRYEEDIRLMAGAGFNAYRFSLEWARIEPQEGVFDSLEVEHYRDVIRCCKAHGLEPMVTLHHFSSPAWLIAKGGWEAAGTVADFVRYVRYIIGQLGSELTYVCTINEANMGLQIADLMKRYQLMAARAMGAQAAGDTAKKAEGTVQMGLNVEKMMAAQQQAAVEGAQAFGLADPRQVQVFQSARTPEGDALIGRAHAEARAAIKALCPHLKVGLTLSLHDFQALPGGEEQAVREWDKEFRHYLPYLAGDDFIGVQNYTRSLIGPDGLASAPDDAELTQANYEYYPEGLEHVIRKVAADFNGPIYVTENGIATDDDARRVDFIHTAVEGVQRCMADGIPVKGYFYWSLMDNFEWQRGYAMRFGLIAVDRVTQTRFPKASLAYLGGLRQASL